MKSKRPTQPIHDVDVDALDRWITHHARHYGPYTPSGMFRVAQRLAAFGSPRVQHAVVNQSIAKGWQGLFAPRGRFAVQEIDDMECPP